MNVNADDTEEQAMMDGGRSTSIRPHVHTSTPKATSAPERLEAVVGGRVQGVGFRHFVRQTAKRLGLVGWVRNERDGTVRVVAEGPPDGLGRLEAALHEGPTGSAVREVQARRAAATGEFDGFDVTRLSGL